MTKDNIISFCFIALLVFVVVQIFAIFSPFFQPIFWSAILSFGFYPIYKKLKEALNGKETLSAFVMTAFILLLVIPPMVFIIANLAAQAVELYQLVTNYIREGNVERLIDQIRTLPITQKIKTNLFQWDPLKENAQTMLLNASKSITNFSVGQVGTLTKNIFVLFLNVLIISFTTFVFLKDGDKAYQFIYNIAPLEEENKKAIFTQINETFSAVIRGQLLTSLTQAAIAGAAFWSLGLPLPIFFAIATFITALIPLVGAAGVWLPFTIYLFVIQSYTKAVILLVVGVGIISLVDNIMKPALIGEKTKLPYFLLFFGILGGINLYGIMGVFLAPVVLSLFFSLIKIYQDKFINASA